MYKQNSISLRRAPRMLGILAPEREYSVTSLSEIKRFIYLMAVKIRGLEVGKLSKPHFPVWEFGKTGSSNTD